MDGQLRQSSRKSGVASLAKTDDKNVGAVRRVRVALIHVQPSIASIGHIRSVNCESKACKVWCERLPWFWRSYGEEPIGKNTTFWRPLERNHPVLTPTRNNWLESGQVLAKHRRRERATPGKVARFEFRGAHCAHGPSHGARTDHFQSLRFSG